MHAPTELLFGTGTLSQLGDQRLPGTRRGRRLRYGGPCADGLGEHPGRLRYGCVGDHDPAPLSHDGVVGILSESYR